MILATTGGDRHAATDDRSLAERLRRVKELFKEIKVLEKATAEKYWNMGRELIAYKKRWRSEGNGRHGQWQEHIDSICGLSYWKKAKRIAEWDSPDRIRGLTYGEAMRRLPKKQNQKRKTEKVPNENLLIRVNGRCNASSDGGTPLGKLDFASTATRIVPPTEDEVTTTQEFISRIGGSERAKVLVNHVAGLIKR